MLIVASGNKVKSWFWIFEICEDTIICELVNWENWQIPWGISKFEDSKAMLQFVNIFVSFKKLRATENSVDVVIFLMACEKFIPAICKN